MAIEWSGFPFTMSLAAGSSFGPYTIVGSLGAGGMGVVYRARDSRLKRDIALKVLPDPVARDPHRVARFQREAELLAGLAHQHIAAIYGIEEADGTRALVLELVEGETLAERIAKGPVSVEDALPLARQIADALDYAHERGVIHRDLKPANIKITPDGHVKILDFGLAKAFEPAGLEQPDATLGHSPTVTSPAFTGVGTLLGTAAYMAPEQARGKTVDKRADIWAFGCVLYEMLAGRRAFEGETISDTLAAVLKSDPDWTRLPASMPAGVGELVRHCLARDLRARLRDIGDIRFLLESAAPASTTGTWRSKAWRSAGSMAAAATVAFGIGWYAAPRSPAPPSEAVRRLSVELPFPPTVGGTGGGGGVAIAPDGSAIAFISRRGVFNELFVHKFADASTTVVRGSEVAQSPVFSPDSRWVAFGAQRAIRRVSIDGGDPEILCGLPSDAAGGFRGSDWSDDGRIVFAASLGLIEVGEPGGDCRVTFALDDRPERVLRPQILPDGRGTVVTIFPISDDPDSGSIALVRSDSTERRTIVRGGRAGRLTASGHLIYARGDQLLGVPLNLSDFSPTAEPTLLLDGVASGQFGIPILDVSDRGDLVFLPGRSTESELVWITREGVRSPTGAPRRSYQPEARLSPDGRRVAVPIGMADHFLWIHALDTGTLTRLTSRDSHSIAWSPDNRKVAFQIGALGPVPRDGPPGLGIADVESTGAPEVMMPGPALPTAWSPDGSTIVIRRGPGALAAFATADRTTRPLIDVAGDVSQAQFSPDGRWLAYASTESGRSEVYVTDFPAVRIKRPVSTDGGSDPTWSHDGTELFFASGGRIMSAAVKAADSDMAISRPRPLFDAIDFMGPGNTSFAVAPDGRFLLVEQSPTSAPRNQLTLVVNWLNEIRRRMPVR